MRRQINRDITVIGGSAGAISALRDVFARLPADYPGAIFVVIHIAPEAPGLLDRLLARECPLPVTLARDDESIRPGRIVVAPPDMHLVVAQGRSRIAHGPRENRHRPSIDVLFRSAAVEYGPRVTGLVMSGMLDDGAAGLWAIRHRGGVTLVQDPADAEYPDMPRNAMPYADRLLSVAAIPDVLDELARKPISAPMHPSPKQMASEVMMASTNASKISDLDAIGKRVPYSCPECGGALWQVESPGPRYRCHVGHAYSMRTLDSEQGGRIEAALWAALRGLEERERLARQLARQAAERSQPRSAEHHQEAAQASAAHADVLRALLAQNVQERLPSEVDAAD